MGARTTPDFTASNYGYISPTLRGRVDLDFYDQALDYLQNYKVTTQGEVGFREGSLFVSRTKSGNVARLQAFIYQTSDTYQIEMTDLFFRFYRNNGLVTQTPLTIIGITKAVTANVEITGHGLGVGDPLYFSGVVGMTQINGIEAAVATVVDVNNITISLDTTSYSSYVSDGTAAEIVQIASPYTASELFEVDFIQTENTMYLVHPNYAPRKLTRTSHTAWTLATFTRITDPFTGAGDYPSIVTLFEGRIIYGASDNNPIRLWFSKILTSGSLDDFTTGTADSDAIIYNVRASQTNRLLWISSAESFIALGTSGSEHRISGGGDNNAITPTNISIKPTSFNGVSTVKPVRLDSYILYPQRNGKTIRSFEYDALKDGYTSPDRTLLADHIGSSKFKQFSFTAGTPNNIWGVRNDGKMAGLTFDPSQQVVAWHLHKTNGLFVSVSTIPDADEDDELWVCVSRTVDGSTVHSVEYFPNTPEIPIFEDYFTGEDNKATDEVTWLSALWNVQKTMVYSDSALIYDGRNSATVNLTIVGTLTVGETVTVTASAAFFTAQMATDNRRIQSPDGGQIRIDTFTSTTEIIGTVLYDVESASLLSGEWYYMAKSVSGLTHLEGEVVSILGDGGVQEGATVASGAVTLDDDAGYVIVGLGYTGIGKTQDINGGGQNGSAMTKPRVITKMGVRLRASLGTKFGTSLYNLESPPYREIGEVAGRPPHLISGVIEVQIPDGWEEEKNIYWLHDKPVPSNIQYLQPMMETNDE